MQSVHLNEPGKDLISIPISNSAPRCLQARFYRTVDGTEPVNDFIESLTVEEQVVLDHQIDLLNRLDETHPHLAFPHSSQISGELRELRCHYGSKHYRILYRRSHLFLILLHAFRKTTPKIPPTEIQIAKVRFDDFKNRMDSLARKPPSATGRRAPPNR